jgi:hypothetical protein
VYRLDFPGDVSGEHYRLATRGRCEDQCPQIIYDSEMPSKSFYADKSAGIAKPFKVTLG